MTVNKNERKRTQMNIKRGDIYYADLSPSSEASRAAFARC